MAVHFQKKEITGHVTAVKGGVEVLNEDIDVGYKSLECVQPASLTVGLGCTVNIGNYNNVKMFVNLNMPCEPTLAAAEECFDEVHNWVEKKLEKVHDTMLDEGKPE